jgi:hypothetical protein
MVTAVEVILRYPEGFSLDGLSLFIFLSESSSVMKASGEAEVILRKRARGALMIRLTFMNWNRAKEP